MLGVHGQEDVLAYAEIWKGRSRSCVRVFQGRFLRVRGRIVLRFVRVELDALTSLLGFLQRGRGRPQRELLLELFRKRANCFFGNCDVGLRKNPRVFLQPPFSCLSLKLFKFGNTLNF